MDEDSYNSRYSFKPPTPPLPDEGTKTTFPAVFSANYSYASSMNSPGRGEFSPSTSQMGQTAMPTVMSQDALEERRRRALKEKERELAARQRQRELLSQKRENELKKKNEEEQLQREKEALRLEAIERENYEKEQRRQESIKNAELKSKQEEEERRRLALVEKKREQALRMVEMQRLREEEAQRIKREQILKKRKEMERIRDEAERMYAERKKQEMDRKLWLVEEMKKKRDDRLVEMEKRRTNPLLIQQEREFGQLVELQASISRVQMKLEHFQTQREDIRERLIEARHTVEKLDMEERNICISIEEVESDLKKLKGFQEGLARLVTTRYEDDDYENSVIKIQNFFRKRKAFRLKNMLKEKKWIDDLEKAAVKIQKIQRGRVIRKMQKDDKMVEMAVKLQSVLRGRRARRLCRDIRNGIVESALKNIMAQRIQNNLRCLKARRVLASLRIERREKERRHAEIKKKGAKKHQVEMRRADGRKKLQNKMVGGELGRIYLSAPAIKNAIVPMGQVLNYALFCLAVMNMDLTRSDCLRGIYLVGSGRGCAGSGGVGGGEEEGGGRRRGRGASFLSPPLQPWLLLPKLSGISTSSATLLSSPRCLPSGRDGSTPHGPSEGARALLPVVRDRNDLSSAIGSRGGPAKRGRWRFAARDTEEIPKRYLLFKPPPFSPCGRRARGEGAAYYCTVLSPTGRGPLRGRAWALA